jgi:hypothetical protein
LLASPHRPCATQPHNAPASLPQPNTLRARSHASVVLGFAVALLLLALSHQLSALVQLSAKEAGVQLTGSYYAAGQAAGGGGGQGPVAAPGPGGGGRPVSGGGRASPMPGARGAPAARCAPALSLGGSNLAPPAPTSFRRSLDAVLGDWRAWLAAAGLLLLLAAADRLEGAGAGGGGGGVRRGGAAAAAAEALAWSGLQRLSPRPPLAGASFLALAAVTLLLLSAQLAVWLKVLCGGAAASALRAGRTLLGGGADGAPDAAVGPGGVRWTSGGGATKARPACSGGGAAAPARSLLAAPAALLGACVAGVPLGQRRMLRLWGFCGSGGSSGGGAAPSAAPAAGGSGGGAEGAARRAAAGRALLSAAELAVGAALCLPHPAVRFRVRPRPPSRPCLHLSQLNASLTPPPSLPPSPPRPTPQIGLGLAVSVLFVTWTPVQITNFLVRLSLPEVPLWEVLRPDAGGPGAAAAAASGVDAEAFLVAGPDGGAAVGLPGAAARAGASLRSDSFSAGGAGGPRGNGDAGDGRAPSPFATLARSPSRGQLAAGSPSGGGGEGGDAAEAVAGGARLARSAGTTLRRGAAASRSWGRLAAAAGEGGDDDADGGGGGCGGGGGYDSLPTAASLPPPPLAPASAAPPAGRGHRRAGSFVAPGERGAGAGAAVSPPPAARAHRRTNSLLQGERAPLLTPDGAPGAAAGGARGAGAGGGASAGGAPGPEVARMEQLMLQGWLLLYGCCLLLMLPSFVAWAKLPLGELGLAMAGQGRPAQAGCVRRRRCCRRRRYPSCLCAAQDSPRSPCLTSRPALPRPPAGRLAVRPHPPPRLRACARRALCLLRPPPRLVCTPPCTRRCCRRRRAACACLWAAARAARTPQKGAARTGGVHVPCFAAVRRERRARGVRRGRAAHAVRPSRGRRRGRRVVRRARRGGVAAGRRRPPLQEAGLTSWRGAASRLPSPAPEPSLTPRRRAARATAACAVSARAARRE